MAESFVFYRSFHKALSNLDADTYKEAMEAICNYALDGIIPDCSGVSAMAFELIKPQIDANIRRRENGKKGGRPKTETKPNNNLDITKPKPKHNLTKTKPEPNVNVNVNDNDNDNDIGNINNKYIDNNKVIEVDKVNSVKEKYKKEKRVYYPNDDELNKAFENFVAHRKLMKKPMGDEAINLNMKKLDKLSGGDNDKAIAILNQSIERGWQGLFELKDDYINTGSTIDSHQAYLDKWRNA